MPDTRSDHEVQVVEVTREEGREMLDRAPREALNISADEFLAKWDAGDYENADDPAREPITVTGAANARRRRHHPQALTIPLGAVRQFR
jgi:hypothetical protein